MEVTTHSTQETKKLAIKLASIIKPQDVVALYGDLGAGKTTFTGFLVEALGSTSRVQSPTFVIARKYLIQNSTETSIERIYHLDLYRIKNETELVDLDIKDFLIDDKAITIVEWPEIALKMLPDTSIKIRFEYLNENSRKIYVENID